MRKKITGKKGHCLGCGDKLPVTKYYRWYCRVCKISQRFPNVTEALNPKKEGS